MKQEIKSQILLFLQKIPKGKVITYKAIAEFFGVHPRAVAMVMKHNQEPLVYPCYKVIAADRRISGYSTPDGVPEKIQKLTREGIEIVDGKVEEKYVIFRLTINNSQGTMNNSQGTMNNSQGTMNNSQGTMNNSQGTMNNSQGTMNNSQGTMNNSQGTMNNSQGTMNNSQGTMNNSQGTMNN